MQSRRTVVFVLSVAIIAAACGGCVPDVSSRGDDGERCRDDGTCNAGLACENGRCGWPAVDSGVIEDACEDAGQDAGTDSGWPCARLDEDCEVDGDCCQSTDPSMGVWCNEEGKCAACAMAAVTCFTDYDCCPGLGGEGILMCSSKNICVPICVKDSDCQTDEVCMPGGECVPVPCLSDGECPGEHCCSGACKPDCGYGPPEACAIVSPGGAIFKDRKVTLHAIAWKGNPKAGAQLVPWTTFGWSSSDADIVAVDADTGELTGGATEGIAEISATSGAFDCGKVVYANHLPADAGIVRVIAYDEATGKPVEGADVIVGSNPPIKTDAAGLASTTSPPGDVHVFHEKYQWVSLVGLGLGDYLVYLRPEPDDTVAGGFRGNMDYSRIRNWSAIIGIAGTGIAADLREIKPRDFTGERLREGGTWTDPETHQHYDCVMFPSSMFLFTGGCFDCPRYDTWTPGREGFNTAWALGGGVPSSEFSKTFVPTLTDVILGLPGSWTGKTADGINKMMARMQHATVSLFDVHPIPKVPTEGLACGMPIIDEPTIADHENFPYITLEPIPMMTTKRILDIPALPAVNGQCASAVFAIGGVSLPIQGFVPLGIAAGASKPLSDGGTNDCIIEKPFDNPIGLSDGQMDFRMAPAHDGLEENTYRMVLLSTATSSDLFEPDLPVSALIKNRGRTGTAFDFSTDHFLEFAQGAVLDTTARTIAGPTAAIGGAGFYEYRLRSESGNWHVYSADSTAQVTLPLPPAGPYDRAANASMTVYAVGVKDTTLANLVSSTSGQHLNDLGDVMNAFSRLTCLKKIPAGDPNYANRCHPDAGVPEPACDPACEVR